MGKEFVLTDDKKSIIYETVKKYEDTTGPLMPILHDVQRRLGCVPIVVQKLISEKTGISIAKINSVVTFYSQFSIEPKGKNCVGVCLGTACYVRGSQGILDAITDELKTKSGETSPDGNYTVETTRCIGACGLAPVFTVNGEVHGNADVSKTKEIIKELKENVESKGNN
ncbi:NAD(P)H-dependent oxidoreductase subunit E [Acholeplasma sp. OttesenSCG-928-E16]|nr:NAD(P)H-dependent oxidoreductase subunit E [Acholeplasma sp. OttesenSCG-928-E16]